MKLENVKRKIEIFSIIFNKESLEFQKKIEDLNYQINIIEKKINSQKEFKNKNEKFLIKSNSIFIYKNINFNLLEIEKQIEEETLILINRKDELDKIKKLYLIFFKKINIYKNYYNKIIKNQQIKLDKKLEQEINDFLAHREKNYFN